MKKKILLAVLTFFTLFLIYAIFVTRVEHKMTRINLPYLKISEQISSTGNIAKWYLPFDSTDSNAIRFTGNVRIDAPDNGLIITQLTGLRAGYTVTTGKQSADIHFDLVPVSKDTTNVTLSFETTLWSKLFSRNSLMRNAEKSLENLRDYFEDTRKMYGYEIEKSEVTDTAFLFRSAIVGNNLKRVAWKELFESMIQFAKEKELGYNGTRILYFLPFGKDSVHLFASIGITNTERSRFNEKFLLKQMPYRGRLLSAYYQGSFGNVGRAINALEKYRTDNTMTSMAIPFIKLITEGFDFDDSKVIQARAFYPVY